MPRTRRDKKYHRKESFIMKSNDIQALFAIVRAGLWEVVKVNGVPLGH